MGADFLSALASETNAETRKLGGARSWKFECARILGCYGARPVTFVLSSKGKTLIYAEDQRRGKETRSRCATANERCIKHYRRSIRTSPPLLKSYLRPVRRGVLRRDVLWKMAEENIIGAEFPKKETIPGSVILYFGVSKTNLKGWESWYFGYFEFELTVSSLCNKGV